MNVRSLFLGLGLGFIFMSLMFFSVFLFSDVRDVPDSVPMTNDKIIEKARELGMIFIKELPATKNDVTLSDDEIINRALDLGMAFISDIGGDIDLDVGGAVSPDVEPIIYVDFVISKGFTANSVAKLLFNKGVIDNAQDFEQFLKNKKATTSLRTGSYSLPKDSSYESVLNALILGPGR